jgi:hypothetical protein
MLAAAAVAVISPEQSELAERAAEEMLIPLQPLAPALLAVMEQPIPVAVVAAAHQQI